MYIATMEVIRRTREITPTEMAKPSSFVDEPARQATYLIFKVKELRNQLEERRLENYNGQKKSETVLRLLMENLSEADMLHIASDRLA